MTRFWHPVADMYAVSRNGELVIDRAEGIWLWDEQGRRYLDATASRTGHTLFIKAVNTNRTSALFTTITIQGAMPSARAELKTVTAPSIDAANDFSRPDAVSIQKTTLPSGRSFVVTLPKHSVSVIVLTTQ